MYGKLASRAKMSVSGTPGTGNAVLAAAVAGFLSLAAAGINDGELVSGCFEDGTNFEFGVYTWTASTSTLTRTAGNVVGGSSGAGTLISLSSSAQFFVTPLYGDLAEVTTRHTVISGPLSSGAPNFLAATYASLVVTTQNIAAATPLLVTAAAGWGFGGNVDLVGAAIANLSWTVGASATSFLPVAVGVGGGVTAATPTTLVPIYQWSGTPSTTNGQYTFNVSEMQMYLGNGSVANKVAHVIVGEVVSASSTVTSTIAYAYNGVYDSGWTSTLTTSAISKNSNLGVISENVRLVIECTTADNGYSVGDRLVWFVINAYATYAPNPVWSTRNTIGASAQGGTTLLLANKSSGTNASVTAASWKYKLTASRGW